MIEIAVLRYASGDWNSAPLALANMIQAVAEYTDLEIAPVAAVVSLDDPELFRYPFVFMTGHLPVRLTARERQNLMAFVEAGGFLFIDDHNHDIDGAFHKSVMQELTRAFDVPFEIPNDHPIYSTYFVFDGGPPNTSHELNGWGDNLLHRHLWGVERNGRLAVVFSNKDYSSEWTFHPENKRFLSVDNTRFAVNLIVYALTR